MFATADERIAGIRGRPGLPLQILGLERLTERDVGFRHENVDRRQLSDRRRRGRLVSGPTRKIGSDAAGAEGDGKNHYACGVHTLHFPQLRRDALVAVWAVEQLFVKAWLMRRI